MGRMTSRSFVGKQGGQLNGKNGCWFVVKAEEKNLLDLDVKWKHKHWQCQRVRSVGNDLLWGETCVSGHGWRVQTQFMVLSKHAGLDMQGGKGREVEHAALE